jgi:NADH dehydrogenase
LGGAAIAPAGYGCGTICRCPAQPDIFVIGDAAAASGADGKPLPGVAPVAKQQGRYVADLLIARAQGGTLPPFRYRDFGSMATIGRKRAVAQLAGVKLSGLTAWVLWSLAHIYFLIGFRNRLTVALNWAWSYATFQRGTRLITGISGSRIEDMMPPLMATPATEVDSTGQSTQVADIRRSESLQHA